MTSAGSRANQTLLMRLYRHVTHNLQWLVPKRLTPRFPGEFFYLAPCSSFLWVATAESACKYSVRIIFVKLYLNSAIRRMSEISGAVVRKL